MKKRLLTIVILLVYTIISISPVYAQDNTSPKAYKEYYNLLNSLVNGNPEVEEDTGIGIYNGDFFELENADYNITGLISAELVDFDSNGTNELFYVYLSDSSTCVYKVYGYDNTNNELLELLSGSIQLSSHWSENFSISLVYCDNRPYVKICDGFYHGGRWAGKEKSDFITFDDNKIISETILFNYEPTQDEIEYMIEYGIEESEMYEYTYIHNGTEESINIDKAQEITNKFSENEKVYLAFSHGYMSDIDLYYCEKAKFISDLRDKSFETSFKSAKKSLNGEEFENLNHFKDLFVEFNKYDKLDYDKSMLLDFVFKLYLSDRYQEYPDSTLNYISGSKNVTTDISCSLPINTVKSVVYDLFGLKIDFAENEKLIYKDSDNDIVFTIEGDNIIRTGFYFIGDYSYERELIDVYNITDNYYLLDITEKSSIYDGVEYIKHSAIVEKLENGKFNLLKTENRTFNDSEVTSYIESIKPRKQETKKVSSNTTVKSTTVTTENKNSNDTNKIVIVIPIIIIFVIFMFFIFRSKNKNSNNK